MVKSVKRFMINRAFILVLCCFILLASGCSKKADNGFLEIPESYVEEQYVIPASISEKQLTEDYVFEHTVYEDGIYQVEIEETLISESYILEATIGVTTEEEILSYLPSDFDDYDIDWPKVLGKFAAGTSVIICVGLVQVASKGQAYFIFASPAKVTKEAFIGGCGAAVLRVCLKSLKSGKLPEEAVKKYAIEGFADGYMWAAIASSLRCANTARKMSKLKLPGGTGTVQLDGTVIDRAGNLVGNVLFGKKGAAFTSNDGLNMAFDLSGKLVTDPVKAAEIISMAGQLAPNEIYQMGLKEAAQQVFTDDKGKIYRVGDRLLKSITYQLNGYTYRTDKSGRVIEVIAQELRLKPEGRPRRIIRDLLSTIGNGFEHKNDDRGHVIADLFDGDNSLANVVAMDKSVNQGAYKELEMLFADALRKGEIVSVKYVLNYVGDSFRPDSFEIMYTIGKETSNITILNLMIP